ncbi:hypothetical protein Btru_055169 [Bulinus truncatus]|nr:hypothetical protein Btru_055169 [Bulinus truncatus]
MSPKNILLLISIVSHQYYCTWATSGLDHDHGFICEPDEKYETYIASNLESLREKCSKLTDCIDRLLAEESAIVVLKGENISLNKTCGLIYKPEGGNYTTLRGKCSATERDEIRSDLETNINEQLDNNRTWRPVNTCLKNKYGESQRTTRVEEICTLAKIRKEICNNTSTHRIIQSFFNLEIQNLQCRCKLLESNKESDSSSDVMPVGGIVGIGIGCFVVIVAIFSIILFCYRRKHKLKSKQNNPNVIYMPAPGSDSAVYQELYDDRNYKGFSQSQPPSLPSRYVQHSSITQDDSGYLEPVMAGMKYRPMPPIPGQASNPGYESPPRYSQYERESAAVEEDAENGYFKPLPNETEGTGDVQATITATMQESNGYEEVSGSRTSIPLEDAPVPTNPVPAKRSKIEKPQEDSHYYVLESGATKDERNTV